MRSAPAAPSTVSDVSLPAATVWVVLGFQSEPGRLARTTTLPAVAPITSTASRSPWRTTRSWTMRSLREPST